MHADIIGKISIGATAIALAAAGSIGLHWINNPKSMEEKFQQLGISLLEDSSNEWTKLVNEYKSSNSKSSLIKIEELNLQDPEIPPNTHAKALQDKCKELLKTEISDPNYSKREQETIYWCINNPKALEKKKNR